MKLDTGSNTQVDTLRFGLSQLEDVDFDVPATPYVVVSLHRYENIFDRDRLVRIVEELEGIAAAGFTLLFVQHPATKLQLEKLGLRGRLEANQRISLLPRLEYLPFLKAIRSAQFVVTDGGGNQEGFLCCNRSGGKPARARHEDQASRSPFYLHQASWRPPAQQGEDERGGADSNERLPTPAVRGCDHLRAQCRQHAETKAGDP